MGFEPAPAAQSLDRAQTGAEGRVVGVQAPAAQPDWGRWLAEIGFLPGERVQLLGRAVPGGDPLVVRVGDSTFALRVAEAACVQVRRAEAATGSAR
jgi:ferrous iron transport protein A